MRVRRALARLCGRDETALAHRSLMREAVAGV